MQGSSAGRQSTLLSAVGMRKEEIEGGGENEVMRDG